MKERERLAKEAYERAERLKDGWRMQAGVMEMTEGGAPGEGKRGGGKGGKRKRKDKGGGRVQREEEEEEEEVGSGDEGAAEAEAKAAEVDALFGDDEDDEDEQAQVRVYQLRMQRLCTSVCTTHVQQRYTSRMHNTLSGGKRRPPSA